MAKMGRAQQGIVVIEDKYEPMSTEDALREMRDLSADVKTDFECSHIDADCILCRVLVGLGYSDLVKAYDNVGKWYA